MANGIGKGYRLCWRREDKSIIKEKKLPVFRVRRVGDDGAGNGIKAFSVGIKGRPRDFSARYLEAVFVEGRGIGRKDGVKGVEALHKGRILIAVVVKLDWLLGGDGAAFCVMRALAFAVAFDVVKV